jgi:hypothetical protein
MKTQATIQEPVYKQRICKLTIGVLLETVFYVRSVHSGYEEEFAWEYSVEFQSFKWARSRELVSVRECEKMALWVQVWSVNQQATAWPQKLKDLHSVKSITRKRLVETENADVCV